MTFQNLICRVPKWNNTIIEEERKRIIERSGCNYLEDLISCVHVIQLKILTCIRVGNKQKKIDISIPKLDDFIHKIYINAARKVYTNVYLFEKNISPLQQQKNNRELEIIVQEAILMAVRESIPTEEIIRAYMDESEEVEEHITIENIEQDPPESHELDSISSTPVAKTEEIETVPSIKNIDDKPVITRLTFNDMDSVLDETDSIKNVEAPKTIERLEEISTSRAIQRKLEEEADDQDDRIKIQDDVINLSGFEELDKPVNKDESESLVLSGIEELF
jgi:hypothetical protein